MSEDEIERAWPAQQPPEGFANRVVAAAVREPRRARGSAARAAAGFLLVASIAAGVAVVHHLHGASATGDVTATDRREVRVDGRAVAVLERGAHVTWSGDAVEQTAGEVFWRVEPGARFVVKTPAGQVTVKGTCFRVIVAGGAIATASVAVIVYEGRVALSHGATSVELGPGEEGRADRSGARAGGIGSSAPAQGHADEPADRAVAKLERARADTMREKLRALWLGDGAPRAAGAPAPPAVASAPAPPSASMAPTYRTMPMMTPEDGGDPKIDPSFIQAVVRNDYFPLARQCYDAALAKNPRLAGRVEMSFSILGDPKIGGVVDDLKLTDGTTIDDPEMRTCMRESMLSVTFDAPPAGGEVTVVYPIEFSPDDDDGGTAPGQ